MTAAWKVHLLAVCGYIAMAVVFSWPLPARLATHLTGSPDGDTGVYVWNQWVFRYELVHERATPYATNTIFSLSRRADLSLHNYTTFANLLALPLIGPLGMIRAFNVIYLTMTVLSAYAMFLLAMALTDRAAGPSWLAGILFAWSPTMVTRGMGHFSLVAAAGIPIFLLLLLRVHQHRRLRNALALGAAAALAAFSDVYYGVFCLMLASGYVIGQILEVRRTPERGRRSELATAVDVLIVCMLAFSAVIVVSGGWRFTVLGQEVSMQGIYTPMLVATVLAIIRGAWHYRPAFAPIRSADVWSVARIATYSLVGAAALLSPVLYAVSLRLLEGRFESPPIFWRSSPPGVDLLAFLVPNPNHPLAPAALRQWLAAGRSDAYLENVASLSFVSLGVLLLAWLRGWRPPRLWTTIGITFALLALGPFVHVGHVNTYVPGPWSLLRYVPIVGLARTPSRFIVVALVALAVAFALALTHLASRRQRGKTTAMVAALLCLELLPAPRTLYSAAVPHIYERIAADPRADIRVLDLPFGLRDGTSSAGDFSARSQFFQTYHHKMLIGGYLSRVSRARFAEFRGNDMLDALLTLSEGRHLNPDTRRSMVKAGPAFVRRARIAYVVSDRARTPPALADFAIDAFGLQRLDSDAGYDLYVPALSSKYAPLLASF